VLRSFCLSLFWPLYCLCFDLFAFLFFLPLLQWPK
jgi:hypothetical protein